MVQPPVPDNFASTGEKPKTVSTITAANDNNIFDTESWESEGSLPRPAELRTDEKTLLVGAQFFGTDLVFREVIIKDDFGGPRNMHSPTDIGNPPTDLIDDSGDTPI